MRNLLIRLSLVLVVTLGMTALSVHANSQQAAQQPIAVTQQQNDMSTQDAKPINGTIVKEKGQLVLKDTAANVSYQLDDQKKAKQFEGKQVKVTGKLDMNSNTIHVENIELIS
jgi:lipopolysaccharide export system protein LptA